MNNYLFYVCLTVSFILKINCSDEQVKPLLLFEATNEGNKEVAEWLLNHGADIDVRDNDGRTPLMRLIERNNSMDMVKFLVSHGANLSVVDNDGNTALLLSAEKGKNEEMLYLMDNKANYNAKDNRGRSALHLAADNDKCSILEDFDHKYDDILNHTDHWGRTPIWYAAYRGNYKCYDILKNYGSKIDSDTLIAGVNGGNIEVVQNILLSEKNINAKNSSGLSLLQIACDTKHSDIAKYLIEKGADINIRDDEHRDLLHICSASGRDDIVSLLISRGSDVNSKDIDGNTPVHYAAMNNELAVLKSLKESGGNIKERNKNNKTPAELAVEYDSLETLKWLINNGYNIDELGSSKKSLCHVAAETGSVPAMKQLLEMDADCNKSDESGNRPIHYAINHIDSLKTLLNKGIEVDSPGLEGKTPLEMALETSNKNAAVCLLKYGAQPDKVRITPNAGDRYFAYVKDPAINVRLDILNIIKLVKDGSVDINGLDC